VRPQELTPDRLGPADPGCGAGDAGLQHPAPPATSRATLPHLSGRSRLTAQAMPPRMRRKATGRRRRRPWSISGASARGSPTGWQEL